MADKRGMKVQRIFHKPVVSIEASESLHEAASRMHVCGFSCLPVVSGEDLVGIITERDVVEAVATGSDLERATVFDYMTEDPETVSPGDDCAVAATRMLAVG